MEPLISLDLFIFDDAPIYMIYLLRGYIEFIVYDSESMKPKKWIIRVIGPYKCWNIAPNAPKGASEPKNYRLNL